MNRRHFVRSSCLGTAGLLFKSAVSIGENVPSRSGPPIVTVHGHLPGKPSPSGIPGLYPGRVVEVFHSRAIERNRVSQPVVGRMLEQGMKELTGESSAAAAWRKFVDPSDVVGIKINSSGAPRCCSSPEIVREVIHALRAIGVPEHNVVVYDRYSHEIDMGSYQTLLPVGTRVMGIEHGALDASRYDLSVYCDANFFGEWETRSYIARLITEELTKIINVPTMKDHCASGVTGCLKNLGFGSFNNVARAHQQPYTFTDPFIGYLCSTEPLRSKTVLHIMDGLRELWHGGPIPRSMDFVLEAKTLFLGTDPVAIDSIELEAIEEKRLAEGALSLWDQDPKNLTTDSEEFLRNSRKNTYYRQPGHIAGAGKLGLGIFDRKQIDYRQIQLT